jgi:hypothetical protein
MSVYKYDENTQTMREYDIAYQVQGQDCPDMPNTLDLINTYEPGLKTRIDSTWLPLLKAVDGEIRIGTVDGYPNTAIWSSVNEIFLEPTDIPVTVYGRLSGAEQIYIYNQAQWGIFTNEGREPYSQNAKRIFIRDDQATRGVGNDTTPDHATGLYAVWVPNTRANIASVDGWLLACKQIVVCAKEVWLWRGNFDQAQSQILYYNDDTVFVDNTDQTYKGTLVPFAKAETEWLDDYFNIEQDGHTIEWYEDTISNGYGKYVRLKKNNVKVAELMYWKDGEIEEEIGENLTDNTITRTGSITVGDLTKTYSITQKPITRTVKARMYFNPVEQDGKMFNNFCMWPFMANFSASSEWSPLVQYIIKIRYKAVGSSTWTEMTLPTADELIQKSYQVAGYDWAYIIDMYTTEINTPGYYDVEWIYNPELYSLIDHFDTSQCQLTFTNRKMYYDYTNHTYEVKANEDTYLENTPFVVSLDYGKQYADKVIGKHDNVDNFTIRDWDDNYNPKMETLSIGPCTAQPNAVLFTGMMTRGLKYLVYNNIDRGEGFYDWVGVEERNSTFSNEGILFYVNPERQRFDDWFLGCSAAPHIIYLHPDIYAMTNHGFDDTLTGWEQGKYSAAGSPEIRELPTNWRELVPNYIGE